MNKQNKLIDTENKLMTDRFEQGNRGKKKDEVIKLYKSPSYKFNHRNIKYSIGSVVNDIIIVMGWMCTTLMGCILCKLGV